MLHETSAGRLIDVHLHPSRTFRALADQPTWKTPFLALAVLGTVYMALILPRIPWEELIPLRLERRGSELGPAEVEQLIQSMRDFVPLMVVLAVLVTLCLFFVIAWLFWRGILFQQGELSYRQSLAVTLHGLLPAWGVTALIGIPMLLAKGEITVTEAEGDRGFIPSNLAHLAEPGTDVGWISVLSSLDLFSFWSLALLTLGFSIVGGVSKGRAAACVVGLWAFYVLIKLGLGGLG